MIICQIIVESLMQTPVEDQQIEIVERKGLGHPDSICDAIADCGSVALCQEYRRVWGRVLHHNLDKIMLVAGTSNPKIGGGTVDVPLKLILGDRATFNCQERSIDVSGIVIRAIKDWIRSNLKWVDPDRHIIYQSEIRPGSPELVGLFDQHSRSNAPEAPGANDTSAAVGFAPFTQTERIVLFVEKYLNSEKFKQIFPETGEDIKVMGVRQERALHLTLAIAFVDSLVRSCETYFEQKQKIREHLEAYLVPFQKDLSIKIDINSLDDAQAGEKGMYLTVLGLSADGADSGQVGRGNRVNGLISLNRPLGIEAHAGKNPVNHVGKIYSYFAHQVAGRIYDQIGGIREVYVSLCSQIGRPIADPLVTSVKLLLDSKSALAQIKVSVESIVKKELELMDDFTARLSTRF